ncbi:hypothetical protein BaRGS_00023445 [Batillaria attramentaria]|uniref:Uncharacterized protein n=1 Tax=Batillaria attramentaria TaxID=370345 RepID=A0ABD0KEA8_9CAEN
MYLCLSTPTYPELRQGGADQFKEGQSHTPRWWGTSAHVRTVRGEQWSPGDSGRTRSRVRGYLRRSLAQCWVLRIHSLQRYCDQHHCLPIDFSHNTDTAGLKQAKANTTSAELGPESGRARFLPRTVPLLQTTEHGSCRDAGRPDSSVDTPVYGANVPGPQFNTAGNTLHNE